MSWELLLTSFSLLVTGLGALILLARSDASISRFVAGLVETWRERKRIRALVAAERFGVEALARESAGLVEEERDGTLAVVLKRDGRRAWVDATPGEPTWSISVAVEVDRLLDLEIRRPTLYRRKRGASARVTDEPLSHEQPDVRFHVARAEDAQGDATERLFVHGGDALSNALAQLLYRDGVDTVLARSGRLGVRFEVKGLVAERVSDVLASLLEVATAYARKPAVAEIGALVERYLWMQGNAPRCPYCHVELAESEPGLTACAKCRTVHHEACFEENGACTLLGCGSKDRVAFEPRTAPPAPPEVLT